MFSEDTCPAPAQRSKGTVEAMSERKLISWTAANKRVGSTGSRKTIRAEN